MVCQKNQYSSNYGSPKIVVLLIDLILKVSIRTITMLDLDNDQLNKPISFTFDCQLTDKSKIHDFLKACNLKFLENSSNTSI